MNVRFSWAYMWGMNCGVKWQLHVYHFEETPDQFPKWLHHFLVPQHMRVAMSSHPCQHLLFSVFFYLIQLSGCKRSRCPFNLHSPNDWPYWASWHVLIGHIYLLWTKVYSNPSFKLLIGLFAFLSFNRSAYFTHRDKFAIHSRCGLYQTFIPFYCWIINNQ